jgi:hypothetical protein
VYFKGFLGHVEGETATENYPLPADRGRLMAAGVLA